MHIALLLIAAGAFFVTGCKTTETASTGGHRVFVTVDEHHVISDNHGETQRVKFIIKDDEGGLTVIEGVPSDPEIEFRISQLKAKGLMAGAHDLNDKHVFIKKDFTAKDRRVVIMTREGNGETTLHLDGAHALTEHIHTEHTGDGDVKMHKEIIIIKGDNEEEVRARLKELGIELDIELEMEVEEVEG